MSSKNSLKSKKKHNLFNDLVYDFVKLTGGIPALLWLRPKVIRLCDKKSLKGGFLASSNHCSFLDPILMLCVFWNRRIRSLATKDLYKNKFLTWLFNHVYCIQVDKHNFSLNSFHEVTRHLKNGKVVSIYPEGQINFSSKELLAFKSGIVLMAHSAKAPIVPIYLVPQEKWYSRRVVLIGEPIDIRELCGLMPTMEELDKASAFIQQKQNELKDYYLNTYKKHK